MQTDNPFLDGLAKMFTDAAGAAQSLRTEIDSFVKQRLEKLVADMDFVPREEFEAVNLPGSVLLSQAVMQQIMGSGSNTTPIVVIDHAGKNGLDAAAYFMGHGLSNVRCLRGGLDAWAQEVDPKMRRYKLG